LTPTYDPDGTLDHQTTAVMSGGVVTTLGGSSCTENCDYDADFGYRYSGDLVLSGHVFYDYGGLTDGTGDVFSATVDTPYSGTVLYLWDANGSMVGTTATDASGQYTFTNLVSGAVYTVTLNEDSPQLANVELTAVGIYDLDNTHRVPVNANVSNVDFGFYAASDFGDLPDSYSTLLASGGPYHITSTLRLGNGVSAEDDGKVSGDASADDDDGVRRDLADLWVADMQVNLIITVTGGTGRLGAWFDWNVDGDLDDSGEFIDFGNLTVGANQPLTLTIPGSYATTTPLFVRFRLFDPTALPGGSLDAGDYVGAATNGEVEDYYWEFGPTAVGLQSYLGRGEHASATVVWLGLLGALALAGIGMLTVRRLRLGRLPMYRVE
jgi:hypothetical protein